MDGTFVDGLHLCYALGGPFAVAGCSNCSPRISGRDSVLAPNVSSSSCPHSGKFMFNVGLSLWW